VRIDNPFLDYVIQCENIRELLRDIERISDAALVAVGLTWLHDLKPTELGDLLHIGNAAAAARVRIARRALAKSHPELTSGRCMRAYHCNNPRAQRERERRARLRAQRATTGQNPAHNPTADPHADSTRDRSDTARDTARDKTEGGIE
jgi:hypothetical protein